MAPSSIRCAYVQCTFTRKNKKDISFFRFPLEKRLMEKWLINCGNINLIDLTPVQLYEKRVCASHFSCKHFTNSLKNRLIQGAVPLHYNTKENADKQLNISTETLNLKREAVPKVYKQSRVAEDPIPSAASPLSEINDDSASELNKSPTLLQLSFTLFCSTSAWGIIPNSNIILPHTGLPFVYSFTNGALKQPNINEVQPSQKLQSEKIETLEEDVETTEAPLASVDDGSYMPDNSGDYTPDNSGDYTPDNSGDYTSDNSENIGDSKTSSEVEILNPSNPSPLYSVGNVKGRYLYINSAGNHLSYVAGINNGFLPISGSWVQPNGLIWL
ncbi:hypothetical protein FQA39_LY05456 [Lamprigera yunnana]|nr:hypothetical protein FQA39_LY05456 [Lamprigera yunnana]